VFVQIRYHDSLFVASKTLMESADKARLDASASLSAEDRDSLEQTHSQQIYHFHTSNIGSRGSRGCLLVEHGRLSSHQEKFAEFTTYYNTIEHFAVDTIVKAISLKVNKQCVHFVGCWNLYNYW
jgi:hypothetical protein